MPIYPNLDVRDTPAIQEQAEGSMIRVLIATPVRLMSDMIQRICAEQTDLAVTECVSNKKEALERRDKCDVLVVSAALPENGALDILRTCQYHSNAPAVVVIGLPDTQSVLLRYLEAGASGCIRDQDSLDELVRSIRMGANRQVALTRVLFSAVLKRVSTLAEESKSTNCAELDDKSLTRREREILRLIAEGYGNRDIAQRLTIELGTTKNHVHNILDKLNVKSRKDAAVYFDLGIA